MEGKYWDKEEVVQEIKKDEFAKYIVNACEKSGKKFINVREWYCTRTDPTYRPAKSGMAIPFSSTGTYNVAMELIRAMTKATVVLTGGEK